VPVGIQNERAVVIRVVLRAQARRAVVGAAGRERRKLAPERKATTKKLIVGLDPKSGKETWRTEASVSLSTSRPSVRSFKDQVLALVPAHPGAKDGKGAQARYDTRPDLGNTPECDGDGYHNRGVGLIQVTGETNIEATLAALGLPADQNDMLAQPEWAAMSAAYYWDSRNLNAIADSTEPTRDGIEAAVRRITKLVNGGYTHLDRRQAAFDAGMSYLANNQN
jgi:predicted chitinase